MRLSFATLGASLLFLGTAAAAPIAPGAGAPSAAPGLAVEEVQIDCHEQVRVHRLPGYGRVAHYHRGRNCRAVIVENEEVEVEDCHRDEQVHRLRGYGRVLHYHRGPNCRAVIVEAEEEDCHRDVRRHVVPGYGRIYHSHRGPDCRVVEYDIFEGPVDRRPRGCNQIGAVSVCP